MKTVLAAALLCLISFAAQGRPSPYPPPDQFAGDRYAGQTRERVPLVRSITAHQGMTREIRRATGGRPRAWCGWYLGHLLGMPSRHLWLARNWATVGSSTGGPQVGAIVVWRHHVGLITGHQNGQWVVKSGNDGHAVRERPRSIAGAIAFRRI